MSRKHVVSVDIGASGGKMAQFAFDGNKIEIDKEYSFVNVPVSIHDNLYWNVFSLYQSVLDGCRAFSDVEIDAVGVDTWGATFALLDKAGKLAEPVFHYRDLRTVNALRDMHAQVPAIEIFRQTGCQPTRNYSLPQLFSMAQRDEDVLKRAGTMLFLPDLFSYFLTGEKSSELSFAGTSALLNARLDDWNRGLLARFGIPTDLFTGLVPPGSIKGRLISPAREQAGLGRSAQVVAACSHDTAAATCAIAGFGEGCVYVGSGTNVNMGMECDFIGLTDAFFAGGFKNTGGMCGKNLIYRDFAAFWFINALRAEWAARGRQYAHEDMPRMALAVLTNRSFLDVDDESFNRADGAMTEKIDAYMDRTGQARPVGDAGYLRCVFESIALKIAHTAGALAEASGRPLRAVFVVNGGSRNALVNQLVADALNLPVRAGLPFASMAGNALSQLYALGEVSSLGQMREVAGRSFVMRAFEPQDAQRWPEKLDLARRAGVVCARDDR